MTVYRLPYVAAAFLLLLALPWAPTAVLADSFSPAYPVNVIPVGPKGEVVETDVRVVCAGKGAYKRVPHRGGTYSQNHRLSQDDAVKRKVMQASGVPWADRAHYEDDHYCPLALGCSDNPENRWAQPQFGRWNAKQKDLLEDQAQLLACANKRDLPVVQGWFQTDKTPDWRVPYCNLVAAGIITMDPACAELW